MKFSNCNKESFLNMFVLVKDVSTLLPILRSRLPNSCHIYNMAMRQKRFLSEIHFYTLGDDIQDATWIIATFLREDCGMDINISHPKSKENISTMKEALINTDLIDWKGKYIFAAIDREISAMIRDICIDIKGNNTCMNPCIMYYLNPSDCIEMEIRDPEGEVEVKRLEQDSGSQFLYRTWKFAVPGSLSYIQKILERNESTGVFVGGKLVSGILVGGSGLMGMLYTENEYRKRGYGKLCMQNHMKTIAKNGLIPCCTVEYHNEPSNLFQKTVGLKFSHYADFITFDGNTF